MKLSASARRYGDLFWLYEEGAWERRPPTQVMEAATERAFHLGYQGGSPWLVSGQEVPNGHCRRLETSDAERG